MALHSGTPLTVIGSVFLSAYQKFGVKKLSITTGAYLIDWLALHLALIPILSFVPLTEGSRSTKIERGTYFPLFVSVKNVSNEPVSPPSFASGSGRPSAFKPCSRRYLPIVRKIVLRQSSAAEQNRNTYNSQALLPSCVPACPI